MKRTLIFLLVVTFQLLPAFTQNTEDPSFDAPGAFIIVEAGTMYPEGTIKESLSIRQNLSYYYLNQYGNGSVTSYTSGWKVGIRYGYFIPRFRTGISAGLRINGLNSEISGYTSEISQFFYLRYSMEDSDTKFARVTSLNESRYLLSIPVELHIVPYTYESFSFYLKAGVEYSVFTVESSTDIAFQDEGMDAHKDEILQGIVEPVNNQYGTLYGAIGIQLGRSDRPKIMVDVNLPSLFLTRKNFSFIDVDYFQGFNLAVQIPLTKNND